ncbi:hypothetical protein PAHAL_5G519200 [Panicum hallii]|uniref:Uncharacterized protein n=1 Tax=Panicum hallii TaxID=206008 RepID=A0A2T8IPA6_9POAL|nr:hypothetical protein PAHAL_5G519200 [Panicum hallii]
MQATTDRNPQRRERIGGRHVESPAAASDAKGATRSLGAPPLREQRLNPRRISRPGRFLLLCGAVSTAT